MQFFKKYSLLLIALISFVFGIWGLYTKSGNKAFDEMDGLIPFYAVVFAMILFVLSGIQFLYFKLKNQKK